MKTILTLFVLLLLMPLHAEEVPHVAAISKALRSSKIAKLELKNSTFEQALTVVRNEWERQHPTLDFPISLAHYERNQGDEPLITMSLHQVPFSKALQYIGETSGRRLIERPDLLIFEDAGLIVEDFFTKSHPASEKLLASLGLGKNPTARDLTLAYAQYGVKIADWMKISYRNGSIIVLAYEPQQEQIAGINHLLSQGFKISRNNH